MSAKLTNSLRKSLAAEKEKVTKPAAAAMTVSASSVEEPLPHNAAATSLLSLNSVRQTLLEISEFGHQLTNNFLLSLMGMNDDLKWYTACLLQSRNMSQVNKANYELMINLACRQRQFWWW